MIPLLLLWLPTASAQDTTGTGAIRGSVSDDTGAPMAAVALCVAESGQCAVSDDSGRFVITGIRGGTYEVEVIPPGQPSFRSSPVQVRAGLDAFVDVTVSRLDTLEETVTVTAPAFAAPEEVKNSSYVVPGAVIDKSAGTLQDVSRFVQTLPGVAIGTNDFRNDIIVRGGSPLENLFIVDNIEIPNINTFANFASAGGTVSILDANVIQDVTFLTGGYPAPYTNRTSSVLQITGREGRRDRPAGRLTLGFAGAGGVVEGPLAGSRGSWIVSARRSFLDLFTDDVGSGGVPVLYTLNAKAVYDLSPRDRIWAVNVSGWDNIRLGLSDETDPVDEISTFDIRYDGWRSASGVNWQRVFGTRGVGLLGITHAEASVGSQVKDLIRNGLPAPGEPIDEIVDGSPTVFRERSREGETTVKYDLTFYAPLVDKVQLGGSLKVFRLHYDTAAPFGSDSPYSPEPGRDAFDLVLRDRTTLPSAYVQVTRDLTSRLNLTLGGRVDHYNYLDATRFSPRAGFSYQLSRRVSWRGSYGRYYQQPFFLFLASFPENRALVPFNADHYVTGLSWTPDDETRVTLEAYRKEYRDYPVARDYPELSLANVGDTFNVREILFPLISEGRGRVTGIELYVERRVSDRLYGQANLAFSRTRHAGRDGVLRDGSFDYPIVANLVGGYRLSPRWELSTRLVFLSGRPYTPFDETLSAEQRRGIYDLSRVNALRAPAYFRLDLRADRTFVLGGRPLTVFGGVQNVTNRTNFAGYRWNRPLNRPEFADQQGIFPIVGIEWLF